MVACDLVRTGVSFHSQHPNGTRTLSTTLGVRSRPRLPHSEPTSLQRRPATPSVAATGSLLSAGSRSTLEPLLGSDLRHIRIHDDPDAARSASALGARAYTVGQHIYFGSGQYAPLSAEGRSLLAHELVHSVQQIPNGSAATSAARPSESRASEPAEREAREIAGRASQIGWRSSYARPPHFKAWPGWPQLHDDGTVHTHIDEWDNPLVASVVYPKRDAMLKSVTTTLGQEEASALGGMDATSRDKAVEAIRAQIQERLTALEGAQEGASPDTKAAAVKLQALLDEKPKTVRQLVRWAASFLGTDIRTAGMSSADLLAAARDQMRASNLPDWAQSILVDYAGMRYKSSHGSWLPAGDLLARILKYDLAHPDSADHILPDGWPDPAPPGWPQPAPAPASAPATKTKPKQPPKLPQVPTLDNLTAQALLEDLDAQGAIPDEVWAVIVEFTELRTQTNEPGWEVIPGGKGDLPKTISEPWKGILTAWRGSNVTTWRPELQRTNRVLATQVVCNELSEAIHARRDITLPGGITANADWFYQEAESSRAAAGKTPPIAPAAAAPTAASAAQAGATTPAKSAQEAASFKQGTQVTAADMKPGATLFFIQKEWDQTPHPWDAVRPVPGAKYADPKGSTTITDGLLLDGWRYHVSADLISRTEELPPGTLGPLKAPEYMHWQHQATVVSVYDSTVITIETVGHAAGITARSLASLSVPSVFVGFAPAGTSGPGRTGEDAWAKRATKSN